MERQDYMMWVFQLKKIQSSATNLQERVTASIWAMRISTAGEEESDSTHPDHRYPTGNTSFRRFVSAATGY